MSNTSRHRMIKSAALLMREHGAEATSFSRVLAHSGAPRGSIYHHFPGGKAQLIEDATRYGGDFIAAGLAAALAQGDPVAALEASADYWRSVLCDSHFGAGCPVVAGTLAGDRTPAARDAAGAAFQRWEGLLSDGLRSQGVEDERARSLATLAFSAMEGAIILARAQRSNAPLDSVVAELHALLRDAVSAATG
jgi:TetR/AcrR family transcriptional regulator, lmrAB and yxaGH operons repressor